jgi:N-acetyl-gamma-glutamyl-phosphate reductase
LIDYEKALAADVIFAALPAGESMELAKMALDSGKLFIDLGADFRLRDENDYAKWYGGEFIYKKIHESAVYGLPEFNREKIKSARIIANPGCYPTGIALALYPALKNNIVEPDIIADSKSGASGAGKSLTESTRFCAVNESLSAYKVFSHRHTPEIAQTLSEMAGEKISVTFTPHLLPIDRGILSTIYCRYNQNKKNIKIDLENLYKDFYKDEFFVRIQKSASIKTVARSNFCDISVFESERCAPDYAPADPDKLIIVSVIDNMIKGAAGQAIQNMNIALGLDEKSGLDFLPSAF